MKNKTTLLVLVAEIIAIVVLHTARSGNSRPENDRSANMQSGSSQFPVAEEKHPVSYTSLK
jgi:hypothetical protein